MVSNPLRARLRSKRHPSLPAPSVPSVRWTLSTPTGTRRETLAGALAGVRRSDRFDRRRVLPAERLMLAAGLPGLERSKDRSAKGCDLEPPTDGRGGIKDASRPGEWLTFWCHEGCRVDTCSSLWLDEPS